MLDKIYEVIAEKYTTIKKCCPECKWDVEVRDLWLIDERVEVYDCDSYYEWKGCWKKDMDFLSLWEKEVSHNRIVMLWDVLDWIEKNKDYYEKEDVINKKDTLKSYVTDNTLWKEKRKPINDQSYECITFIFNLINNDTN